MKTTKDSICAICGAEYSFCQVHELVRIRVGESYLSLTGDLTHRKDEAKLFHPSNIGTKIMHLSVKHKDLVVKLETNRN